MLYYGERKKGCRFMEVTFHGFKTLILENDYIRTMILVEKGTDIFSLVHKNTDTDFVWTNPMGYSVLEKRKVIMDTHSYSNNYLGGMFEILPNFGDDSYYKTDMYFPKHCEVSHLPYDMQVVEDSADCVKLKFTTVLSKLPFRHTKTLTLKADSMALCFEEELENLSYRDLPYVWAQHPCVGKPFLDEDCVLELPFTDDIKMPPVNNGNKDFWVFDGKGTNYGAVRNQKTGLGVGFSFDETTFTHVSLWVNAEGDIGHHALGGAYVTAIMPMNSPLDGLQRAFEAGVAPILKAGETKKPWFTISVFQSETRVNGINKDGTLL